MAPDRQVGLGSEDGSDSSAPPLSSSNQRTQAVFIRSGYEIAAMPWNQRLKIKLRRVFCCQRKDMSETHHDVEERGHTSGLQYRLEATNKGHRSGLSRAIASCICGSAVGSGATGIGMNHNQRLASSLHWMFRVNFIFLFAVMCTIFFVLVIIFAGLIVGAGRMDQECVRIGGNPFGYKGDNGEGDPNEFADAFALSWTTFSTVGYGSTYPALGHENDNPTNCLFITLICSLESFLGVLYSGFCGAILFGKVLRIQSHAQVVFSDPIVIRYGKGVQQGNQFGEDEEDDEKEEGSRKKIPCPVLEFRVVNRLFGEVGGEIMDATLNVVANVDANDADPSLVDSLTLSRNDSGYASTVSTTSDDLTDSGRVLSSIRSSGSLLRGGHLHLSGFFSGRDHQAVDEDPSARLVNKRIFSKMLIEASDHPFFKRVWLGRHVLDDTSPVLRPKVRRAIRKNNGYWPERLNSHEAVRGSLQFNQILVSLNGVSNVSASDVYAQKIYDFVDINVGYQFVNILYKDTDGALKVDTDLINDVREQNGGGGEPLIIGE